MKFICFLAIFTCNDSTEWCLQYQKGNGYQINLMNTRFQNVVHSVTYVLMDTTFVVTEEGSDGDNDFATMLDKRV